MYPQKYPISTGVFLLYQASSFCRKQLENVLSTMSHDQEMPVDYRHHSEENETYQARRK